MSKFVGTGPSSYKKRIYRAAASQNLRNTVIFNGYRVIFLEGWSCWCLIILIHLTSRLKKRWATPIPQIPHVSTWC